MKPVVEGSSIHNESAMVFTKGKKSSRTTGGHF